MQIGRRTLLASGAAGLALAATRTVRAAAVPKARFFIAIGGPPDGAEAKSWASFVSELEERGFAASLVETINPNGSFTPNQVRAAAIVAAAKEAKEPAAIIAVSNEGNYLPLVAAAYPVRRLVYVNACIPEPGKAFIEIAATQPFAVPGSFLDKLIKGAQPVTDEFLKLRADPHATDAQWQAFRDHMVASPYAHVMKNFYEVCPLKTMPHVDNVDVSGAADEQISPAWEQATARQRLKVEPTIVPGASHIDIVSAHASELADAAVRGL